jgi:hypothetical protein
VGVLADFLHDLAGSCYCFKFNFADKIQVDVNFSNSATFYMNIVIMVVFLVTIL